MPANSTISEDAGIERESYEARLSADFRWAMEQGGLYFQNRDLVHKTMYDIAARLETLGIPYAVCGGLALFAHGFRRFTEDVDILVTREGRQRLHEELRGRGYLPPFEGSKHLRDTDTKVRIEFLTTGDYPGDGRPKPVAFPAPDSDFLVMDGIRILGLRTLVELKLASGVSSPHRGKDLTDVGEVIKTVRLPRAFADQLDSSVRPEFLRLWDLQHMGQRFLRYWPLPATDRVPGSIEDLIALQPSDGEILTQMKADGIRIEPVPGDGGRVVLITDDPDVAARWDLHDERDFA